MAEDIGVVDNPAAGRFELIEDGEVAGRIEYRLRGDEIVLVHTEIDQSHAGRGFGSVIARGALDLIRESGRPLVVACPFVERWIGRNPEYADLVVGTEPRPPRPEPGTG